MSTKLLTKTTGKSDKKVTYKIEKDFSINNVEIVKNEINEIINKSQSFHLEMKNLENFDLSAVQLIHALKKKLGNEFSYSLEIKDEIKTIIQHSGFEYLLNK